MGGPLVLSGRGVTEACKGSVVTNTFFYDHDDGTAILYNKPLTSNVSFKVSVVTCVTNKAITHILFITLLPLSLFFFVFS